MRTSTSKTGSQESLRILTYKIMTLQTIQIQTGGGKTEKNHTIEEETEVGEEVEAEEDDSSSTFSSSSSISLDFEDEASKSQALRRSKKRKDALVEGESAGVSVPEEKIPQKKFKTYDFHLID